METSSRFENSNTWKRPSQYLSRIRDKVPARVVLYILSFSGFLVSFMMRTDMNIAIVEMVKTEQKSDVKTDTYCYEVNTTLDNNSTTKSYDFDWSDWTRSIIISSFYWCYILSQVIGGVLTQYFGTKTVFGGSQLITAICSLLIPVAADMHYGAVIALRSIQGIASGLTWPAMYAIVGHWIPPAERSRFMSSFQGFSFGIGLTYTLCGVLIKHFGWPVVFYTTGSIGVTWCIIWYFFAFDTPASHPRISQAELEYIQQSLEHQVGANSENIPVPWKDIMTSVPTWAIAITTFGRIWVHYVFITSGPMYMKTVLGFDIQTNGLLTGAPFICSYLSSVVFCHFADIIITRKMMSLLNVRKIFTAMSQVIPGLLVLLIGYLGCNTILALIVWFIAVTLITAAYAGAMVNIVDIAPNLAGPVLAFAQTIHMTASFLSPLATGWLTDKDYTLTAWRSVFGLTAVISCSTYIVYQIWGTAEIQSWNYANPRCERPTCGDSEPLNDPKTQINGKIIPRKTSDLERQ